MPSKLWDVMNDLEMVTAKIVSAREIIDTAAEAIQKNEYDKAETLAMAAYEFLGYYLEEFDEKFKLAWQETVKKQSEFQYTATGEAFEIDTTLDDCMPPWGHSDLEYLSKHKEPVSCDKDDPSPECKGAWNSFWEDVNDSSEEDFQEILKREGYEYTPLPAKEEKHSEHYYDYSRNDSNRLNYEEGWVYESPDGGKTVTKRRPGSDEKIVVKEEKVKKWVLPVEEAKDVDTDKTDYFVTFPDDLLEAANLKEGDEIEWVDKGDGSYLLRKVTKPLGMDEC